MTPQLRRPVVQGLHRGAGTSTLAAALHAHDSGHAVSGVTADIVVCGADPWSLTLADAVTATGPRPVLALRIDVVDPARVRALEGRFGVVVMLPTVARWHGLLYPLDEAAVVLGQPPEHLPRAVRAYAAALRHLAAAVLRSGQLDHPDPPSMWAARTVRPPVAALPVRDLPSGAHPISTAPTSLTSRSADPWSSATLTPAVAPPRLLAAPRPVNLVVVSGAGRPASRELTVVRSNRSAPSARLDPSRHPAPPAGRTVAATADVTDATATTATTTTATTTTAADQDDEALEAAARAPVGRVG